jgi:hypothetical protein
VRVEPSAEHDSTRSEGVWGDVALKFDTSMRPVDQRYASTHISSPIE